jgi:hypothetical protein
MPVQLLTSYNANKTDLFQTFMLNGKSLAKCVLVMKRRVTNATVAKDKWEAMQERDLLKVFPAERVAKMIKNRVESGQYYNDSEFPDEAAERWYWVRRGSTYEAVRTAEDSMEVSGQKELSTDEAEAIVGQGGVLEVTTNSNTQHAASTKTQHNTNEAALKQRCVQNNNAC